MLSFLACCVGSAAIGIMINEIIIYWYSHPITETKEGPHFYAVKEINVANY